MDLPPVQLELVRLGLQGQPVVVECQPSTTQMRASLAGLWDEAGQPCRSDTVRIRIDEPAGWPVLPPPPVPTLQ
jgi:hypothetical protein